MLGKVEGNGKQREKVHWWDFPGGPVVHASNEGRQRLYPWSGNWGPTCCAMWPNIYIYIYLHMYKYKKVQVVEIKVCRVGVVMLNEYVGYEEKI